MGVSPWEDVSGTFMIPIRRWPLTSRSNLKLCVRAAVFLSIDIVIPYLAHECITMRCYVKYMNIQDLCTTLTFSLNIKIIFSPWMYLGKIVFAFWHRHTKFGTWVYHHETKCCVHSLPLYDLDLWHIQVCGWRGYPQWVLLTVVKFYFQ